MVYDEEDDWSDAIIKYIDPHEKEIFVGGKLHSHYIYRENEQCFLMQYTGLKDIDDKEIWEGDIVKIIIINLTTQHYGKVIFDKRTASFCFKATDVEIPLHFGSIIPHLTEAIGNIFENPELLIEEK